jgi:outer membrane protein OmpA-like peptidoglycan-associated protein
MPTSPLSFASTSSFRNALMAKNLSEYTVVGVYTPPTGPINYETVLGDSNVIDSPNDLNILSPNNFYTLNDYGPLGGYSVTIDFNGAPYPSTPNQGPYPDSFLPSSYSPYSILLSTNPNGSNGSLSQDSFIAKLGAQTLKGYLQERINLEIYQSTVGAVNLSSLQDPFEASLLATGQQPLIYRNWKITVPENPLTAAVDFATRLTGSYWPVSFIPGDYFLENENNSLPTSQTSAALGTINQLTGGLLGPVLNLRRNPSQIFLANTGNGQKSALFANLYYNKYGPEYNSSFTGLLGVAQGLVNLVSNIVDANGTVRSSYYVGSPKSEPGDITSPANQIPVDERGRQIPTDVYGPSELGKLYEGNINNIQFGLGSGASSNPGGIDGQFVWVSPKYKKNAGFKATVGGGAGSKDDEFNLISSKYQSNESTNLKLKEGSILDDTQKLVDSADNVQGPTRLQHVGNAMNQVSKVFHDGYKEITKGSQVVSYKDNTTGAEAGIEYCRVFTKDTPYYTFADLQKTDGITTSGRRFNYSILDNTYNLNIAPMKNPGSTNIVGGSGWNDSGGYVKKYMFSIENLAWRTSSRPGFRYEDLPICERGPNGGRVMWFPPYDVKFSDQSSANWNPTNFIGRPEPIYTYKDTSRSGSLTWKIIVDNPSVMNILVDKQLKGAADGRVDSILNSFFAGCVKFDLYTLAAKYNQIPISELEQIQEALNNPRLTPEELAGLKKSVPADNNVVGGGGGSTDGNSDQTTEDPSLAAFKSNYNDFAFYFDNDIPKTNTSNFESLYNTYVSDSNIKKYNDTSSSIFITGDKQANTNQMFDIIKSNYKKIADDTSESNFILDAYKLLKENKVESITITMAGSASAVASIDYNKALSQRRINSVREFLKTKEIGGVSLKEFMQPGKEKILVKESPQGEQTKVTPKGDGGATFDEVNCTDNDDIKNAQKDKTGKTTKDSQVYSLNAMACRRVSINDIILIPKAPTTTTTTTAAPINNNNNGTINVSPPKPQPTVDVSKKLKEGLSKKVLRRLLSECDYFEMVKENDPMIYNTFKEKIKFFNPAFHSMTPEGLNSRLTFLNQCVRPGETIPVIDNDGNPKYNDSLNTSFGTPPVLILRIGDFFNTKIIPNNVSFSYEMLDLNPEGIGVQPMIVEVQMSFNIIGGMGLKEPVDQLQNALSFNYYANTEIYDERATYTDTSFEALDKQVFDAIVANSGTNKPVQNSNQQKNSGGSTIGEITKETPITNGATGYTVYQKVMDKLVDTSKTYFENITNQLEKIVIQYNYGILQLMNNKREYYKGKVGETDTEIYGKPQITDTDTIFKDVITGIESGANSIITKLTDENIGNNEVTIVKQNMVQYVKNMQSDFNSGLTLIINDITSQENDLLLLVRQLNLVSNDKTDGKIEDGLTPKIYNLTGSTESGDVSALSQTITPVPTNTYDELKYDYKKVNKGLDDFIKVLKTDFKYKDHTIISTFELGSGEQFKPFKLKQDVDQSFFMIMARIFTDTNKFNQFRDYVISPQIKSNKKLTKNFDKACEELIKDYGKELEEEIKLFDKFKKSDTYKKYTTGIEKILYPKGKVRRFYFSTVKDESTQATQEQTLKNIYGNVDYGNVNDKEKFDGKINL